MFTIMRSCVILVHHAASPSEISHLPAECWVRTLMWESSHDTSSWNLIALLHTVARRACLTAWAVMKAAATMIEHTTSAWQKTRQYLDLTCFCRAASSFWQSEANVSNRSSSAGCSSVSCDLAFLLLVTWASTPCQVFLYSLSQLDRQASMQSTNSTSS